MEDIKFVEANLYDALIDLGKVADNVFHGYGEELGEVEDSIKDSYIWFSKELIKLIELNFL